jgi:hypothetical protein
MSEKTKRKGTPIHPYVRLFAAFLPCIGIGILEVVFFLSTGYLCLAFPLSIVALVIVGNLVWKEEADEDEKPKRDEEAMQRLRLEEIAPDADEEENHDTKTQGHSDHA